MKCSLIAATAALLCVTVRAHADGQDSLVPSDFAYGLELEAAPGRALQTLPVPLAVYRGVLRADLADVRVFNRADQRVPYAIRSPQALRHVEHGERNLPLFPLYAPAAGTTLANLSLHVERAADGTVIDVRNATPPAEPTPQRVIGYVLDASGLDADIAALRLALEPGDTSFTLRVDVEASDDLTRWTPLASRGAIVRLVYAGRSINRDRIEFPTTHARFLRVSWIGQTLLSAVTVVSAELAASDLPLEFAHVRVAGRALAQAPGSYEFDFGGPIPAHRARVLLPQRNTLIEAELSVAAAPNAAFEPVFHDAIYRVEHGGDELTSAPIDAGDRRARYYHLRVDGKGGGLGQGTPELEIEYLPDQLLFIARGEGPFRLAYGSHKAEAGGFGADEILGIAASSKQEVPPQTARITGQVALAGASALAAPPAPAPIRTYVLWTVLIATAILLASLALRLLRKVE